MRDLVINTLVTAAVLWVKEENSEGLLVPIKAHEERERLSKQKDSYLLNKLLHYCELGWACSTF